MTEHHDDNEYERLRKLLKELPKAGASKNFEANLQRRIQYSLSDGYRNGFLGFLAPLRRVPTLAYSLVTLLLVGGISYYAFFKHGSIPSQEQSPPDRGVILIPEKSTTVIPADTVREKRAGAAVDTKDIGVKEAGKVEGARPQISRDEKRSDVKVKSDEPRRSLQRGNIKSSETRQDGKPANEMMIHEENAAAKEMAMPVPGMMMKKAESSVNPSAREIVLPNLQSVADSVAHADSLKKLDSLRRAQKRLWIDKRKKRINK